MPQLKLKAAPPKKRTSPLLSGRDFASGFSCPHQGTVSAGSACIYLRDEHVQARGPGGLIFMNSSSSGVTQAGKVQCSVVMPEGHVITRG